MKNYARIGMAAAALMSVWGILYPEMYLHPDVIRTVSEDGSAVCQDSPSAYARFLDADSTEITVRWKLAECLEQYLGKDAAGQERAADGQER